MKPCSHPLTNLLRAVIVVLLTSVGSFGIAQSAATGASSPYVQSIGGHLYKGGQRFRMWGVAFWGYCGELPVEQRYDYLAHTAQRMKKMGFNSVFYWPDNLNAWTPGLTHTWKDGTVEDQHDWFLYQAKLAGISIVHDAFADIPNAVYAPALAALPAEDPWKKAVQGEVAKEKYSYTLYCAAYFDNPLAQVYRTAIHDFLYHRNQYTGKYGYEEEAIAMYNLGQERNFITRFFGFQDPLTCVDAPRGWPAPFAEEAKTQWNAWLVQRYGSTSGLMAAWSAAALSPDESLEAASVRTIANGSIVRQADLMRFLYEKEQTYLNGLIAYVRSLAPPGVGANVVPISADIMNVAHPESIYVQEMVGDAQIQSTNNYFDTWFGDEGVWRGEVQKEGWSISEVRHFPNGMAMAGMDGYAITDKQWSEGYAHKFATLSMAATMSVAGKPVIHMGGVIKPAKYRAEYLMRLATFASWMDWDGIFLYIWQADDVQPDATPTGWHYQMKWMLSDKDYVGAPLSYEYAPEAYFHGVLFATDEIFLSQSLAASAVFQNGSIHPAPNPTLVTFGADALLFRPFDPEFHNLQVQHPEYVRTAFQYGLRIDFDITRTVTAVTGPIAPPTCQKVVPSDQIEWDWPLGRLVVDTPQTKAFVGFNQMSGYQFKDGVEMGPTNTNYTCFVLTARDGSPLMQSQRMVLSVVSTSENVGLREAPGFAWPSAPGGFGWALDWGKQFRWDVTCGVATNRVATTVRLPRSLRAQRVDFSMQSMDVKPPVLSSQVSLSSDKPVFVTFLQP